MDYFLLIILVLTSTSTQASLVTFEASPHELKANLTDDLGMRCAVTDNNADDIKHISSIFITKNEGADVASITTFDPALALTDPGNLEAKGSLSATSGEGTLQLTWVTPGVVYLGDYMCQVSGVDSAGHTVVKTSSLTLSSSQPSIDDVIQAFNAKFLAQEQVIQTLTQENKKQEAEISEIKTCQAKQVAFNAAISYKQFSGYKLSPTYGQYVKWDNVTLNIGGAYKPSSGEFHCTVSGVYVFNVHSHGAASKYVFLQLEKNGLELVDLFRDNEAYENGASLSHVLRLVVGDVVGVKVTDSSVLYQVYGNSNAAQVNYFNGHLISAADC